MTAMRGTGRGARWLAFVVALAWAMTIPLAGTSRGASGDLDTTFGVGGRVTTPFPIGAFASAVAIDPGGRIVAVGAAAGPSSRGEFAVARYEKEGTLDPSFGDAGTLTTPVSGGGDEARSVAIQRNGRIVVAGTAGRDRFAVARYRDDGALDTTFGSGGIVRTDLSRGDDVAYDVAIQPDGKIVAVGSAGSQRPVFALARYHKDGTLDRSFGTGGKVLTPFGIWGVARSLVLQPNGRIVVAGFDGTGFALARYRPDGRLDRTFGEGGRVIASFPLGAALVVALQPDGKIVAAGGADIFELGLARYRPNGRLDRTFGSDGRVILKAGGGEQGIAGLVIQANGRIVAAGHAGPHEFHDDIVWRFVVVRLRPNGHLDASFGGDGRVSTYFRGGAFAAGLAAQRDGRLVVVGGAGDANADAFALARYLP